MLRVVHVAVGVVIGADNKILIAKRPDNTHQGGLWEFPGGKVDAGESVQHALVRELHEELAIAVVDSAPLIKIRHNYSDKSILLDVWKITKFDGEPLGNEGQPIRWVTPDELMNFEFPAANKPIVTAINLPQRWLVTGEAQSHKEFIERTELALRSGIKLIQLRVKNSLDPVFSELVSDMSELCRIYSAKLQLNTSEENFLSLKNLPDHVGLHLNSNNLMQMLFRSIDKSILLSASCHNEIEIDHAQKIGIDFCCISPVLYTDSHRDAIVLGWERFAELVEKSTIPVYALGGMSDSDVTKAVALGAQGIAAISVWWNQ
ncbi:MAG: Nudix family hydrolase [Moraxellaceae bacterium]|nr:MAG: Nudix family hydrolase [Moraxellaceae bacterium]